MSKIKIIALSMLAMAVVFSSCKDDDEEVVDDPLFGPSLVLTPSETDGIEGYFGDAKTINYTISTGNGIKSLEVTNTAGDTTLVPNVNLVEEDFDGSENEFSSVYSFTMPTGNPWTAGDSFSITFKAAHSIEGVTYTTTKTVTVTYVEPVTVMGVERDGQLNNLLDGDSEGAYDLVANTTVASSGLETSKDMKNTSTISSPGPNIFDVAWVGGTGNMTMYVKDNAFNYDGATVDAAIVSYAAGTPSADQSDVAEGDIFVAKLRGTDDYAVIKIGVITLTTDNNDDNIAFTYKKVD